MKFASFQSGQRLTLNSVAYEVFRVTENRGVVLESLQNQSMMTKNYDELISEHEQGNLVFLADDTDNVDEDKLLPPTTQLPECVQSELDRKIGYIKLAEAKLGSLPCVKSLSNWIDDFACLLDDKNKPSALTIYRWWKAWSGSGKDIQALVPKPRKRRSLYLEEYKSTILEIAEKYLFRKVPLTRKNSYEAFILHLKRRVSYGLTAYKAPSQATYYRLLNQIIDPYDLMVAQKGRAAADKFFRATGKGVVTSFIFERVEIDHTPLDVMVIDESTGEAIGRPNCTMLIDHYTRMPLGFYIGFEPPSTVSVMRAIRHAILPKSYMENQYPEIKNKWPVYGCFSHLVCDNGAEFHSSDFRRFCNELNIEIMYCPGKQPYYKGAIERFLGTLNREIFQKLPGTTFSCINTRGEYESVKLATISENQARRLIYKWISDIYMVNAHTSLWNSPLNVWLKGLKKVELLLPARKDDLDLILTKQYSRTLSHKGVEVERIFYNSHELGALKRTSTAKQKVFIRVDPENLGNAWVLDDVTGKFFRVPCTEPEYAEGLSLRQHLYILKQKNLIKNEVESEDLLQDRVEFNESLLSMSKSGKLRTRTKAARLNQNPVKKPKSEPKSYEEAPLIPPSDLGKLEVDWGDIANG